MKKLLKKVISKGMLLSTVNAVALIVVIQSVNSACFWMAYQPDVPKAAEKFMHE